FLRGLVLDGNHVVKDKSFLAITREPQFASKFLPRPQMIKLHGRARHVNVFGHRQKIELRITQQSERIADLIEKTFGRDVGALAKRSARDVENVMMPRARRMQMQIEIARDRKEIVELFQLVDAQLSRSCRCSGGRVGRTPSRGGISLYSFVVYAFVHFS